MTSPTIDKVDGRDITFTLPTSDGGVSRYVIVVSKEVPSNTEAITNIPAYSQGARYIRTYNVIKGVASWRGDCKCVVNLSLSGLTMCKSVVYYICIVHCGAILL